MVGIDFCPLLDTLIAKFPNTKSQQGFRKGNIRFKMNQFYFVLYFCSHPRNFQTYFSDSLKKTSKLWKTKVIIFWNFGFYHHEVVAFVFYYNKFQIKGGTDSHQIVRIPEIVLNRNRVFLGQRGFSYYLNLQILVSTAITSVLFPSICAFIGWAICAHLPKKTRNTRGTFWLAGSAGEEGGRVHAEEKLSLRGASSRLGSSLYLLFFSLRPTPTFLFYLLLRSSIDPPFVHVSVCLRICVKLPVPRACELRVCGVL